jgi:hypothetical protein
VGFLHSPGQTAAISGEQQFGNSAHLGLEVSFWQKTVLSSRRQAATSQIGPLSAYAGAIDIANELISAISRITILVRKIRGRQGELNIEHLE